MVRSTLFPRLPTANSDALRRFPVTPLGKRRGVTPAEEEGHPRRAHEDFGGRDARQSHSGKTATRTDQRQPALSSAGAMGCVLHHAHQRSIVQPEVAAPPAASDTGPAQRRNRSRPRPTDSQVWVGFPWQTWSPVSSGHASKRRAGLERCQTQHRVLRRRVGTPDAGILPIPCSARPERR